MACRSAPIASLFGLAKHHGVGPGKDANRLALRLPALCGVPTLEDAPQVLEIPGAQQKALSDGVSSLTTQRRQIRTAPHHLEQLGSGREQGPVELIPPGLIPPGTERSARSPIISLPNGDKEGKGPLSQHHETSLTQATGVGNQVQNPVKAQTPI